MLFGRSCVATTAFDVMHKAETTYEPAYYWLKAPKVNTLPSYLIPRSEPSLPEEYSNAIERYVNGRGVHVDGSNKHMWKCDHLRKNCEEGQNGPCWACETQKPFLSLLFWKLVFSVCRQPCVSARLIVLLSVGSSIFCIRKCRLYWPVWEMHPRIHKGVYNSFLPLFYKDSGIELIDIGVLRFDEAQVVYSYSFHIGVGIDFISDDHCAL